MTNQQGAPEALRLADALASNYFDGKQGRDVWDAAADELRHLHAENERLAALVEAQQPAPTPQADSQPAQVEASDAMADSQYLAGVSAGWNAANADDPNEALRKLHESRAGYLKPIRAARAPADSVLEDADPLQGAANWLAEAHGQFCVAVLQGCLMIGYNRAKRLHDAAIAARKQGGAT